MAQQAIDTIQGADAQAANLPARQSPQDYHPSTGGGADEGLA